MSLSASTVWEVRPTNGNDTNGGGFVTGASGTDYSQQNAKNTSVANISTTDGVVVGTGLTSATGAYSAAVVGNIIFLSGTGVTAGWYQAVSFAGVTITLDRAPGNGTAITVNIGGALATVAQGITNASVAGMLVYCKAESTYVTTTVVNLLTTGFTPSVRVIGYTTTRSDNGKFSWQTATNSIKLINTGGIYGYSFENFAFKCTAGTPGDCFHAVSTNTTQLHIKNCIIDGFNIGINGNFTGDWAIDGLCVESCEIKNCVSHGIINSGLTVLLGCAIHNNGGSGMFIQPNSNFNSSVFASFCAFKSNAGDGVNIDSFVRNGFVYLLNCALVSNTGNGLFCSFGTGGNNLVSWNCIYYGNGAFGINGSSSVGVPLSTVFRTNAFGANTSGPYNQIVPQGIDDITLTADPFTNRTGTPPDLSLNSTAGGGAACSGAGVPATLPFS